MSALVSNIDDMVAELNERGERWDIHQTHDRRWVVTMGDGHLDKNHRSVNEPTITLALAAALASKKLPVVPQRPAVFARSQFDIVKEGSNWYVKWKGVFFTRTRTKRDAEAIIERNISQSQAAAEAWDTQYLRLTTDGTDGVDFRWGQW